MLRKQPHLWKHQGESPRSEPWPGASTEEGLSALIPLAPPLSSFSPAELGTGGCCGGWVSSALPAAPGLPYKALMVPPKPRFHVTPDSPSRRGVQVNPVTLPHPVTELSISYLFRMWGKRKGVKQGGDRQGTDSGFLNSSFYCIPWVTGFQVFYWTTSRGEGGGEEGRKRE